MNCTSTCMILCLASAIGGACLGVFAMAIAATWKQPTQNIDALRRPAVESDL